jgi:hypothetical protein
MDRTINDGSTSFQRMASSSQSFDQNGKPNHCVPYGMKLEYESPALPSIVADSQVKTVPTDQKTAHNANGKRPKSFV